MKMILILLFIKNVLSLEKFDLIWSNLIGSSGSVILNSLSIDSNNNIFISGYSQGYLDGNINNGYTDSYLTKYNSIGEKLWTRTLGTGKNDESKAVAIDKYGNIFIAGNSDGNLDENINKGEYDVFLTKYNNNGDKIWTKLLGSDKIDKVKGIDIDSNNNIYITGFTYGNLDGKTLYGDINAFLTKFSDNGEKIWTKMFGTDIWDFAMSIKIDILNNIYVVGSTYGDFDSIKNNGRYDGFVVKFDSNGDKLWSNLIGTNLSDEINSISIDSNNNLYIIGLTYDVSKDYESIGFLTKYNKEGEKLWTKSLDFRGQKFGSIAIDSKNNLYIGGSIYGNLYGNLNNGGLDVFLIKYNNDGEIIWTNLLGSKNMDNLGSIAIDSNDNLYIGGSTNGNLDGNLSDGGFDVFLTKFNNEGQKSWTKFLKSSNNNIEPQKFVIDSKNNVYIGGSSNIKGSYVFLTKYNYQGEKLWTRIQRSGNIDYFGSIYIDSNNNIYITGSTNADQFITKYNTEGEQLWTKLLGSGYSDNSLCLTLDFNNNIYIAGFTYANLDGYQYNGQLDVYLIKYNTDGEKLWTKLLGYNSWSRSITIDSYNNIYLKGAKDESDVFITKFNTGGEILSRNSLGYGKRSDTEFFAIDTNHNVYITQFIFNNYIDNTYKNAILLTKYNPNFDKLWTKPILINDDYYPQLKIFLGNDTSINYISSYNNKHNFIKLNSDGDQIWEKSIDFNDYNTYVNYDKIFIDHLFNIYITLFVYSKNSNIIETNLCVSKINSNGDLVFLKLFENISYYINFKLLIDTDKFVYIMHTSHTKGYEIHLSKFALNNIICENSCSTCISNNKCLECNKNYYKIEGIEFPTECYDIAPLGFYLNENLFKKCDNSCETCINSFKNCLSCNLNYIKDDNSNFPTECHNNNQYNINQGELIYDISEKTLNFFEFKTPVDIIKLYPEKLELLDTNEIIFNTNFMYKVISINIQLLLFSQNNQSISESSIDFNLFINGILVTFDKNINTIKYTSKYPHILSDDSNYLTLELSSLYTNNYNINQIRFRIVNLEPIKSKLFIKLYELYALSCHPKCKNCNSENPLLCSECYSSKSQLNCECYDNQIMNSLRITAMNNYFKDTRKTISYNCVDKKLECDTYITQADGLSSCKNCKNNSFETFDDFINSQCKCRMGLKWNNEISECINEYEKVCDNYNINERDIDYAIQNAYKNNKIRIKINYYQDYILNQNYYNLDFSYDNDNSNSDLSNYIGIRMSIKKGSDDIFYINSLSNSLIGGININVYDLKNDIYDCESKTISNGAVIFTCNVKVYLFDICKSYIYMQSINQVKFGIGGVIDTEISLNASGNNIIDIPCINDKKCFFNDKFTSNIFICDNLPCLKQRTKPFVPGELINIKPILSVLNGNPDKYSLAIEYAAFIIISNQGNKVGKFEVTSQAKLIIDNGKNVFGFFIPIANSLMTRSGYIEGANLVFNLIFRVDGSERRILQGEAQNSYSLISPIDIKIEIDLDYLEGGTKFKDLRYDERIYIIIIIFSCLIISILAVILLYNIKKNRNIQKIQVNMFKDENSAETESMKEEDFKINNNSRNL